MRRKQWLLWAVIAAMCRTGAMLGAGPISTDKWPPPLPTADANGTATLTTPDFLKVPESVQRVLDTNPKAARLAVAKTPPTVELAYDNNLPDAALNGTGWSAWGDICLAGDGKVYLGTGNHGGIEKGQCFIYCWDPAVKAIRQIADVNKVIGAGPGEVHVSKVHAGIFEGRDKKIYFTGTLDDGGRAGWPGIVEKWTPHIPGGLLCQYDPATGKTVVYANLPPARVTATTLYDARHNILYCGIEGSRQGFAMGALDLEKKQWIYQSEPGAVGNNRNMMLDRDGNVYFNGKEDPARHEARLKEQQAAADLAYEEIKAKAAAKAAGKPAGRKKAVPKKPPLKKLPAFATLWKYDPTTRTIAPTKSHFDGPGIRSSTRETKAGYIYGTTMGGGLFRYRPANDELTILGPNFLERGEYVTVCDLSPDEKYVYYLPGAHGSAGGSGTAVIQYDIAAGRQKAIAFLLAPMIKTFKYAPAGTYGIKISSDGSTLYVGLNGSPAGDSRPKGMAGGFGLTSFAAIHIPASERP